jgi:Ser/Thr protein kinase RdoA (MazF antagonist)
MSTSYTPPVIGNELILSALKAYFEDPQIFSTTIMAQGKENTSVFVEGNFGKVVIRIWGATHAYMGVRHEGDVVSELAFMQFCYDHHFPVPKIYKAKNNELTQTLPNGEQYAVIGYVEGESPRVFSSEMVSEIAATMAALHIAVADFTFPQGRSWPGTLIEMTEDRIHQFEAVVYDLADLPQESLKRIIARYQKQLKQSKAALQALPKGAIHGDIMRENVKFKDGKLEGIFDFDDCRQSYFIEDIVKTLLFEFESPDRCVFGEDGKNVHIFLDSYRATRALTDAEEALLPLFLTARFIYQLIGYYAKLAKDKSLLVNIQQSIERYEQYLSHHLQRG